MDKINKARNARSLSRVNLSGKHSLTAHHECELMGSDFALHLRPRWNQEKLKAAQINRYFFHGEASVAMEAVYVRRKVDLEELQSKTWEDLQHYAEDDIREAFRLLSSGASPKSGNMLLAVGVNALHLDLLEDNSSFHAMVLENLRVQSLSMGYFVSKDADIAAIRVVFRVHVDTESLQQQLQALAGKSDGSPLTLSVTNPVQKLIHAGKEDVLAHALAANCLGFLFGCLDYSREQRWRDIAFGGDFYDRIVASNVGVQYHREAVFDCMSALIERVSKSLAAVTKRNLYILTELVVLIRGTSPADVKLIDTAMKVLKSLCRPRAAQSTGLLRIEPFTDFQRKFAAEDGLKFLIDAADLVAVASPARQLALEEMILSLMKAAELCSSKPALLVHWRHWMAYFIENGACASTRANAEFLPLLLQEIHNLFFARSTDSDWENKVMMVSCGCGCKGSAPESLKSAVGVMKLYLGLLLKDKGVLWGQDGMKGPSDCLAFFSWTLAADSVSASASAAKSSQYQSLQLSIFDALCAFLERMTSADRLLHFLSDLTPKLLELLLILKDSLLQRSVLKVLSLAMELAIEKAVWKNSVQPFLSSLYRIIRAFCSPATAESPASKMNALMVETLFHRDPMHTWEMPSHEDDTTEVLRRLLHEEHFTIQQARAAAHRGGVSSRGRSLLESLIGLAMLPPESPLQQFCLSPILIGLGWLLNNAMLAEDCAELGLDLILQGLIEGEHFPRCILAARVFCILHFQLLPTKRAFGDNALKRLGNALTITMGAGARMTLSHLDASGSAEQLRFSPDQYDSYLVLERFDEINTKGDAAFSLEHRTFGDGSSSNFQDLIWKDHEWGDPERAATSKLVAFLNLLAVFSCLISSVRQVKHSEELKQIQQLLWRFIRDREFVSEGHMALYLFALRNIVFALGSELLSLSVPMYNDLVFLQKLLTYPRKKSSKLLAELASGLLWALASAYESTEVLSLPFIAEFEDPEATATLSAAPVAPGSVPQVPKTTGIGLLSENILTKFNHGGAIDCDIAALSFLLQSKLCDDTFFHHHDYPFVIKLLDSVYQTGLSGSTRKKAGFSDSEKQTHHVPLFGTMIFYTQHLPRHEKELIQLCRLAHSCLLGLFRSKPSAVESMIPRTKTKVLRLLLDQDNTLLLHQVVLCIVVHLRAHPLKCSELVEPTVIDTLLALTFAPTSSSSLRATAFTCLRLMLIDPKCQTKQYGLEEKLVGARHSIVSSLRDASFEVKKQALILAVDFVFHVQQEQIVQEFGKVFTESSENQTLLADLFTSLSTGFEANPETGYVLQLLVRLVVRLDLIALTDTEQLVGAICMTLRMQSDSTFLRPLLCNCLFQIASEAQKAGSFARKTRLNTITDLLTERLTLGELRSVGGLLVLIAEQHEGIRRYLNHADSGCIAKISRVLGSFFEISTDRAPAAGSSSFSQENDGLYDELSASGPSGDQEARYVVRMAVGKRVFVSHFTDDIYEQFLYLLAVLGRTAQVENEHFGCTCVTKEGCPHCSPCDLIAKAACGRAIARFLISRLVLLRSSYDLAYFLGSSGVASKRLEALSLHLLSSLSFSHSSRQEILQGYGSDWNWVRWIMDRCVVERSEPDHLSDTTSDRALEMARMAVMCLGQFCAEEAVAFYVLSQREFLLSLFSHVSSRGQIADSVQGLDLQRAALFTIARLAEYRKIVVDPLFQEKTGSLLAHIDDLRYDPVSLANAMILTRNFALFTPKMQGRIADASHLAALAELLLSEDDGIARIAADVLAHALYFEKPKSRPQMVTSGTVSGGLSNKIQSAVGSFSDSLEAKSSAEDSRRAFLPRWKRLFCASMVEEDGDMQLLDQALDDACSMLGAPTRAELLRVVLELHLRLSSPGDVNTYLGAQNEGSHDSQSDMIAEREHLPPIEKARLVQQVLPAPFRNSPEPDDNNFHGCAHLWQFLQKLWLINIRGSSAAASPSFNPSLSQLQAILSRWKAQSSVTFSELTHTRRARFLGFAVSVMETVPEMAASSVVIDDAVSIADELLASPTTSGVVYQLLYTVCKQSGESVDWVTRHFTMNGAVGDDEAPHMSHAFRSLIQGVKLEHLVIKLSVSKIKGQETDNTVSMLNPRAPSTSAVAYAVGLLNIMSARSPAVLPWFVECQGVQVIFDLLLMDSAYAKSLPPNIQSVFSSSLVETLARVLHLYPDTVRYVIADARILHRVVRLVYALKSRTQLAALEVLHSLSNSSSKIRGMLFRLEYFSSSLRVVEDWMADCFQTRCTELQVSPALRPRDIVELAHLTQLPFFMDLKTTEIMRLSMCFVESRLVEEDSLMIIVGNGRFGKIPSWMVSENLGSEFAQKRFSDLQVMKRIDEEFKHVVAKKNADGSLLMYKIQKEGYWRCTTELTRKSIAKRIEQFVTRDEQFFGHLCHKHASSGLISRACRLLIEDRAESVRRAAFSKKLSEETVFNSISNKTLSDLLSLLTTSRLFFGVARDKLACLAYRLSSPTLFTLEHLGADQVAMVLDEGVKYQVHVKSQKVANDDGIIEGSLLRGGILGFPEWLTGGEGSGVLVTSNTHVNRTRVLAVAITYQDLEAELGDSDTQHLIQRCRKELQVGGARQLLDFMASPIALSNYPPSITGERSRLQSAAMLLLRQLLSSRDFAARILTNTWAAQIICEVAVSALPSPIVSAALEILGVLVEDEVLCKRFCALEIPFFGDESSQRSCPLWATKLVPFTGLVGHFSISQWATNAQVLTWLFRIQHHVFKNVPTTFKNISDIWTVEYLQQCQFAIQQDRNSEFQTAEAVAAHLIQGTRSHAGVLLERGRAITLHLDVVSVLTSTCVPIRCVNLVSLLSFFCSDPTLRDQMWTSSRISIASFDHVLFTIATDLHTFQKSPPSSTGHRDDTQRQMIRAYCEFLLLICASNVDEQRDLAFRERVELRFSILSTLIQLLSIFEALRLVLLRCIGVICLETPDNCAKAQAATIRVVQSDRRITFVEFIMQDIEDLQATIGLIEHSSEVEAILLCVQAFSHSYEGAKVFSQKGFVTIAMAFLRILPDAPTAEHLLVWRALALTLQNFFEYARDDFLQSAGETVIHTLVRFFAQLSDWYRIDRENFILGRMLRDFLRFLVLYMTDATSRQQVDSAYFQDPVKSRLVTDPCYHWIARDKRGLISGTNSGQTSNANLQKLDCDLEIASLELLTNLVQDEAITRALADQKEFNALVKIVFQALDNEEMLARDQTPAILRFLCFFMEQLAAIDLTASEFLRVVSVPILTRIFQSSRASSSILAHTTRQLWLYQAASVSSCNDSTTDSSGLSKDEAKGIATVVMDRSKVISANPRILCNVLGLIADLLQHGSSLFRQHFDDDDDGENLLARLLRMLLPICRGEQTTQLDKALQAVNTLPLDGGDPFSAVRWESDAVSCPEYLTLGVLHQFTRCFRHVSQGNLLLLLGKETPSRADRVFKPEVFVPSVQLLSGFRSPQSEFLRTLAQDSLGMLENVFRAFIFAGDTEMRQSRVREYRRIGKQENLLSPCFSLLGSSDLQLQYQALSLLAVYCERHVTVWDEIQNLRCRESKDLLDALIACVTREHSNDQIALSCEIAVGALRVFNLLVEFSYVASVHAYSLGCLERFVSVRASGRVASSPDLHREFELECLRVYHFVLRMHTDAQITSQVVIQELWNLLCKWVVRLSPTGDTTTISIALGCIGDCRSVQTELINLCSLEWDTHGERFLQRLAGIAGSEESVDDEQEHLHIRQNAVRALEVFYSNQEILDRVWDNRGLARGLLANLASSSPLYHDRIQLISKMIKMKRHTCRYADGPHFASSFSHLLKRYEALDSIPIEERAAYLEILPTLIVSCKSGFSFQVKTWTAIVENVLFFLQHSTPTEAAAAHTAFHVFLKFEDNRCKLSDALPVLKQIWTSLYRALEHGVVQANESPSSIVSFLVPSDSDRRKSVNHSTTMQKTKPDYVATARVIGERYHNTSHLQLCTSCREIRLATSTVLQLGRILSCRCEELRCVRYCVSLLMSQVCYMDSVVGEDECLALSEVLISVFLDAVDNSPDAFNGMWVSETHFTAFGNWLIRAVHSSQSVSQQLLALSLLSKLLEGSARAERGEAPCAFDVRHVLANAQIDVIDAVWWSVHTTSTLFAAEHKSLALWCNILRVMCTNISISERIMAKKLVHNLVWENVNSCFDTESLSGPNNESLVALVKTICRLHQNDPTFLDENVSLFELLADHCLRTVVLLQDVHIVMVDATELLSVFSRREHFVQRMWKSCLLFHGAFSKTERRTRRNYLRGVSEMVLISQDDVVALEHSLHVLHQLCTSELNIDLVILARQGLEHSMVDIIQVGIRQTVGTSRMLELRLQRNASMTQLSDFLPCPPRTSPNLEGCRAALSMLKLCMANAAFVDSLQNETEIFSELFASLGCPDWEIARSAASIITSALRWPAHAGELDPEMEDEDLHDISTYLCPTVPTKPNQYRRLTFFALMNEQDVFGVEPDDTGLSSIYLVLVAWIQFYSKNLHLLQRKQPGGSLHGKMCQGTHHHDKDSGDETPRGNAQRTLCEQLLFSILEILLYLLANFFSVVYDTTADIPLPEEIAQHSALCAYLLGICKRDVVADQHVAVVEDDAIRSRALALLHMACSFDLHRFSAEIFTQEANVARVLTIIETTKIAQEQKAAVRLLYDISSYSKVKDLFVSHQTLLLRVCSWLENPRLEALQLFAIGILKNLATKSIGQRRQNLFTFAPSFQDQLARTLFQGKQYGRKASIAKYTAPKKTVTRKATLMIAFKRPNLRRSVGIADQNLFPVLVKSHIEILSSKSSTQRMFQIQSQIRSVSDQVSHQITLDETDYSAVCTIVLSWGGDSGIRCKAKQSMTHPLASSEVRPLNSAQVRETAVTLLTANGSVVVSFSERFIEESIDDLGPLGRLLRHEDIDLPILADAISIVAELCKSHAIFCDARLRLWDHVLSAMSSHAQMRTSSHAAAKVDLTCLHSLSSWFWSKPGVIFFKTSMAPLLALVQGMRSHGFATRVEMPPDSPQKRMRRQDRATVSKSEPSGDNSQTQQNFLTALVEWVAAIETPEFTENCLNILFLENTDVLLFLCSEIFPARSARASFFFLVATVVRTNMVHCEVFARKHALQLLLRILDKPNASESEASRAEMLQYAARAIAKISRHAAAREKFVRHGGIHLFGRVAFEVYRSKWLLPFPFLQQAAENLVLATSFLCDFVSQCTFVNPSNQRDVLWVNLMTTRDETVPKSSLCLSVVEALLHYLGRTATPLTATSSSRVDHFYNSFDRLAASVLSSLVEKSPRRVSFERQLLQLLLHRSRDLNDDKLEVQRLKSIFTTGLKRSIALTKWDFQSDLNVIRRTYCAGICAGVRTGVTPPKCRGVLMIFDQDFLLSGVHQENPPPQTFGDTTPRTAHADWFSSLPNEEKEETGRANPTDEDGDDEMSDNELKELFAFAVAHKELVNTLTENRKKHLTQSIKIADRNSRVQIACHWVLSLALDFYVDMVAVIQTDKSNSETKIKLPHQHHHDGNLRRIAVVQKWLMHLEELSSLACCGLHELDFNYYGTLVQQLCSLITELPAFLRKMERVQSKTHTLLLFLKNVNTLLRRIANRNELKGVAANGSGVADEARKLCERLQELEPEISEALAYVLTLKSAHERFARMLVAMDYMWKRVLGSASLSTFMEGGTQSADGILIKVKRRLAAILAFLTNPVPFFFARWRKTEALLAAMMKTLLMKEDSPSAFHGVGEASKSTLASNVGEAKSSFSAATKLEDGVNVSHFPFCSMESLLDHFGYISLRSKKTKQTMSIPTLKPQVLQLLSQAFASPDSVVEKLSVLQLEANFQQLASEQTSAVFLQLRELLDEADAGIQIDMIEKTPLELSFWRLIVRPIQRVRLYHLHFLMRDFMSSDLAAQQEMLNEYRLDEEAHANRRDSLFGVASPTSHEGRALAAEGVRDGLEASITANNVPPVIKKAQGRGRRQTLLEVLNPSRLLKIVAASEDSVGSTHRMQASSSDDLFHCDVLAICDKGSCVDPLSEEMAVEKLRKTLHDQKTQRSAFGRVCAMLAPAPYRKYYATNHRTLRFFTRLKRRVQLVVLVLAFWRQEELTADLKNELLAKAFDSPQERDEYFISYHVRKAFTELMRIWMPESGNLGLRLWQTKAYFLGGTLVAVLVVYLLPQAYGGDEWQRNAFMTQVISGYVISMFIISVASIFMIMRNRFVLQERDRIRFTPVAKYYGNSLAVVSILVELVQLNSLTFDQTTKWNDTDQIPKLMQWLGKLGITEINIAQVELKGMLYFLALVVWFVMLKSANKFQDSSPMLNHLFTKDLPTLFHGFLYMSTISTFFSFLSCIDCQNEADADYFVKCALSDKRSPPFLLSYQSVPCWSGEHKKYALLGIWGITFFLPIGLLSQGLNQVLFQQEKLDIKYAPFIMFTSQFAKALTVTAKAFYFSSLQLALIGLIGNGVLFLLMISTKSCSLWFVKLIKSGIYAASCWSSFCAIYGIKTNADTSISLIYIGWLTVAAATMSIIFWRLRRQAERKQREDRAHWEIHRSLLAAGGASPDHAKLSHVEQAFLTAAKKRTETLTPQAAMFAKQAQTLSVDEPPAELERFMRRANALASGKRPEVQAHNAAASAAVFMRNAREAAKHLESADGAKRALRTRRLPSH